MRTLLLGALAPALLLVAASDAAAYYIPPPSQKPSWCTGIWHGSLGTCQMAPAVSSLPSGTTHQQPPVATQITPPVQQPQRPPVPGEAGPRLVLPGGGAAARPVPGAVASTTQVAVPQPIQVPSLPGTVVAGPQPVPQPLPRVVAGVVAPPSATPGGGTVPQLAPGAVVRQGQGVPPQVVMVPSLPGTVVQGRVPEPQPAVMVARPVAVPPLVTPQRGLGAIQAPATQGQVVLQPVVPAVSVQPDVKAPPVAPRLITREPGRQALHAQPHFEAGGAGTLNCIASGHAMRSHMDANGVRRVAGAMPGFVVTSAVFQDVPAAGHDHAECLIAVLRRDANEAGALPQPR